VGMAFTILYITLTLLYLFLYQSPVAYTATKQTELCCKNNLYAFWKKWTFTQKINLCWKFLLTHKLARLLVHIRLSARKTENLGISFKVGQQHRHRNQLQSELKALWWLLDAGVECESFVGFSRNQSHIFYIALNSAHHQHLSTQLK